MQTDRQKAEHILVCLSSAPSNAKIVQTAAKMAKAFDADFTALYVRTPEADRLSEEDKNRLQYHMRLAEQCGAAISTVYGLAVSEQIAEFARVSGVTKIVIGRSAAGKRRLFQKPTLTDSLIDIAPNLDIYIIPDAAAERGYKLKGAHFTRNLLPTGRDLLITLLILAAATGVGSLFWYFRFTEANIITIYILGVLLTALFTKSYGCSVIISLASVLVFNYFFTEPRLTLHAYEPGYPFTFAIMLISSLLTGTLANKLKNHAKQSAESAFRTKVLLDTEQLLQKAEDEQNMVELTATQLLKLLDREIILYVEKDGGPDEGRLFSHDPEQDPAPFHTETERKAVRWAFEHGHRAGATTEVCSDARCLYLAIVLNDRVFGVVGIHVGRTPPDSFEYSILLSILGECALAIENNRNAREKEQAALRAKNEQLRANLLRSISHDLRTPLTSISGNADTLLNDDALLDPETRKQIFTDIYDDSMWLINLVENLLSVTRIEEGRMNLHMSSELVSDVIEEALRHIDRRRDRHEISVCMDEELLLARMDARLICQVIINLVDNAIKYTPDGSVIRLGAERRGEFVAISVADDGPGLTQAEKDRVFDMFYTGENRVVDSRRSLGLGLALCRSVVRAHGGEITVRDNQPKGCVFEFTLPSEEVDLHE